MIESIILNHILSTPSHLREKFEEHNQKLEEAKGTFVYTENTTLELKQQRRQLASEVQVLERTKRDLATRIADITDQHLGPRVEEDTLVEEKQRLMAKLEQMSVEHSPLKATMDDLTAQLEAMSDGIKETERVNVEYESKLDEARSRVNELRDKLTRLELSRTDKARMLQELEQRVTSQRSAMDAQKGRVDGLVAATDGQRVRARKTAEEIRDEISILNAQREVSTQITETRDEIMAELSVLEEKVAELNAEFELGRETLKVVRGCFVL